MNPKALFEHDGKKQVFRINDDKLETIAINTGRKIGDNLEITGNIKSGDKLVLSPSDKLKTGTQVVVGK